MIRASRFPSWSVYAEKPASASSFKSRAPRASRKLVPARRRVVATASPFVCQIDRASRPVTTTVPAPTKRLSGEPASPSGDCHAKVQRSAVRGSPSVLDCDAAPYSLGHVPRSGDFGSKVAAAAKVAGGSPWYIGRVRKGGGIREQPSCWSSGPQRARKGYRRSTPLRSLRWKDFE